MKLFGRIFGDGARNDTRVDEAVQRVLALHPQLKLARRCEALLAPALAHSLAYLDGLLATLPAPRDANAATWSADPWMHAFFGSPDSVARVISASQDLRGWFERHPQAPEVYAVLGMEMVERRVLGVEQHGDSVRRDVPQTTLSFADHQLRMCGCSEADLKADVLSRLVEQLGLEGLARIDADKSQRDLLAQERALLRTRMQLLARHGAGVSGMFDAAHDAGDAEADRLRRAIEDNQRELERCGTGANALERELETVRMVFVQPQQYLSVWLRSFRLNPMNIVVDDPAAPGADLAIPVAHIPGAPPRERAFALVRFARRDLREARDLYREAERLLG